MTRTASVLGTVFLLGMSLVCARLGVWQLSRLQERRAANEQIVRGMAASPVQLTGERLAAADHAPQGWGWRRARAEGVYDPAREFVLRGRSAGGRPGVHLVTPLRVHGRILLVERGWVPAPDAARPPVRPRPPAGEAVVEGVLRPIPATGDPQPSRGGASVQRLHLPSLRARFGDSLAPVYLMRTGADTALPRPLAAPVPDEGPHLGYAVQWFAFAAIGVIGWIVLLMQGRRVRNLHR